MSRIIVLTPQMVGADGISAVSREVVSILEARIGSGIDALDVWSLGDAQPPAAFAGRRCRFRTAGGNRLAFASFGVRDARAARDALVMVLHAHLLPVTLPLLRGGARVVPLLLGIEAWKPFTRLQRAALRRSWRVAAISQHTVQRFRSANPELSEIPVRVCHLGVPEVASRPGPVGSARARLVGRRSPPYALIVGRMSAAERYKGHDLLLDVWAAVTAVVPGATLVVAGGGDDEGRLRARAESLGLSGVVRFEGRVPDDRLAALYRDAACFVMPSRDEGFGLVYLEAMGAGTPCIAAAGAAEEIIEDGVSGLIVDPRDPRAVRAALVRLLTDDAAREAMGRAAARRVADHFQAAHFGDRLLDLLDLPRAAPLRQPSSAAC